MSDYDPFADTKFFSEDDGDRYKKVCDELGDCWRKIFIAYGLTEAQGTTVISSQVAAFALAIGNVVERDPRQVLGAICDTAEALMQIELDDRETIQ